MNDIEQNWRKLKSTKFRTNEQDFKPYNLMEIRLFQPLDAQSASLFNEDHIFRKIHLDRSLLLNFAFPIDNPNSALLTKVSIEIF